MRIKAKLVVAAALGAALAVGGSIAYASVPDGGGVIHGCYAKTSSNQPPGSLRVIDTGVGQNCAPNESPLNWSQTGPQGPPGQQGPIGPSDAYLDVSGFIPIPTNTTVVLDQLSLPAGAYTLFATAHFFDLQVTDFDCSVRQNGNPLFSSSAQVDISESVPFAGAVSLPNGGVVDLACSTTGQNLNSQSAQLVATKVGALH